MPTIAIGCAESGRNKKRGKRERMSARPQKMAESFEQHLEKTKIA
jgi:hypothetical protein